MSVIPLSAQAKTFSQKLFDQTFYLSSNPDVLTAVSQGLTTAFEHFSTFGHRENRPLLPFFDTQAYLTANLDVAGATTQPGWVSAWNHFVLFGILEGRSPNGSTGFTGLFDNAKYLAQNSDVAAAVSNGDFRNGFEHYLLFGAKEGRAAFDKAGNAIDLQSSPGKTFTLTDKLDIFTNVGSGTVNAVISSTAADTTWQTADQISGGTTGSTLNLTAVVGGHVSTAGRATSGIENFNITFVDNDAFKGHFLTVDASTLTGAKNFTILSANASSSPGDGIAFTGLTKAQKLTIKSADSNLNVTVGYKSGELSGTSDEVAVSFNGAKLDQLKINDISTEVAETVILNAVGGTSIVTSLDINSNELKTLKVTGAGNLTVTDKIAASEFDSGATKNTIDASGASGKVTLRTDLTPKLDAKGGSGTSDRLILDVASSVTTGAAISGFERVDLQASNSATVKATLISGATALNVLAGTDNTLSSNILTLNDVAAGTGINIVGTGKNEAQWANGVTYNQIGALSGTNDSVTIKISNGGTAVSSSNALTVGLITADNIETVTVDVADFAKVDGSLTIANAKSLTLTGAAVLDLATFTGGSDLGTINAGGYSGKLTLGTLTNVTGDLTYTGSSGVDSLTNAPVANNKTQTFNLGGGADTMTINVASGNSFSSLTVNGEGGDDVFTIDAGSDSVGKISINGGDGTDTIRITGTGANKTISVSISGIEKIDLVAAGPLGTTLDLTVPNGFNDAITITDASSPAATQTIKLNVGAGGSVNGSNLAFLGWTSGTDILQYVGNTGNETFTLGAKVSGQNITEKVVFKDAASNGIDTIKGFTVGSTNQDIIVLVNNDTTASTSNAPAAFEAHNVTTVNSGNPYTAISGLFANKDVIELVNGNAANADLDAATDGTELLKYLATTGSATQINVAANGQKCYLIAYDNGNAYLYHADSGSDSVVSFNEIKLVGVFEGVAPGGFVQQNVFMSP